MKNIHVGHILHVAYQESTSQEICSLFVKLIHANYKAKVKKNSFLTALAC